MMRCDVIVRMIETVTATVSVTVTVTVTRRQVIRVKAKKALAASRAFHCERG